MKIVHLLTSGNIGGIEVLCKDIGICADYKNAFCFLFGKGLTYEQMKASCCEVYDFSQYQKVSVRRLKLLIEIAKTGDVIIVHHDDPYLELYYLILQKVLPHKKYISMVHHCYEPEMDKKNVGFLKLILKRNIQRKMFQFSDKLIFVSKAGYKSYLQYYLIDESKVEIIYNGIDEKKINHGRSIKKKINRSLYLLYVGRLVELKGVDDLITAFYKISSQYDLILNIVGDGKQRFYLEEMVKKYGIDNKVKFWGFKQNVTPFLEDADVFVYPSKTEIFGISLVEAMAYQCICVANNIGGIPEIISNEKNGLLNLSNTTEGLTVKIEQAIRICSDPIRKEKMRESAQKTAAQFCVSNTISELGKLCSHLLGG